MNDKIRSRLVDCLEAAYLVNEWAAQHDEDQLQSDIMLESAFLLQFERIGETLRVVRDADPDFESLLTDIHEWVSLRHHLIHDYREVDLELLWQYATVDVQLLIPRLEKLISRK